MRTAKLMTVLMVTAGLTATGGAWAQTGNKDARDAAHEVAKEKCDALAGAAKDNGVRDAKVRYGKSS